MRLEDMVYFCAPARLVMGAGCRAQLPALLQRLGYRRGLLVTDPFFATATPWVDELVAGAQAHGVELLVHAGGMPDPTTTLCDAATAAVRAQIGADLRAQPVDHVIALGGGSNIDLAKALCLTLPHGKPVRSFVGRIPGGTPILPLVAMPTTAGTGSEATPGAILVDPDNATKVAVMDNRLRPVVALVDPEFTYTCPPRVTADAGIDALTHAIESYLLCSQYLLRSYQHGSDDTEARIGMSHASVYAALSYGSAGLNAVHGIAYAVAGLTHLSHGTTNAVMLPYVLDALRDVRHHELLAVARLFGIDDADAACAVARLPGVIRALIEAVGIPTTLRAVEVRREDLDRLVRDALDVTRLARAFPVPDVAARYASIVHNAWAGTLAADRLSAPAAAPLRVA